MDEKTEEVKMHRIELVFAGYSPEFLSMAMDIVVSSLKILGISPKYSSVLPYNLSAEEE